MNWDFCIIVGQIASRFFYGLIKAETYGNYHWFVNMINSPVNTNLLSCLCGAGDFKRIHTFKTPPEGETTFDFSSFGEYRRDLFLCGLCGHFISVHKMVSSNMYRGEYVDKKYIDQDGIRRTFEKIIALPPSQSDNTGRVKRILDFARNHFPAARFSERKPSLLDIGSGLCVFPYKMKEAGWDPTALDPDPRSCNHAEKVVGIKAVCADFLKYRDLGKFDVVTFNKVLEHVKDPVSMLAKAKENLLEGGFVYVELPDGEAAIKAGPERQEFNIDHFHIFSMSSLSMLVKRAGFYLKAAERLRDPSGKYTLRGFLTLSV